jgi:hypothetical protein
MLESGWTRSGEVEFSAQLRTWRDARELLTAAMNAALVPFLPYWLGAFDSAEDAAAADQQRVGELQLIFDAWAAENTRSGTQRRRIPCRRPSPNNLHRHRRLR